MTPPLRSWCEVSDVSLPPRYPLQVFRPWPLQGLPGQLQQLLWSLSSAQSRRIFLAPCMPAQRIHQRIIILHSNMHAGAGPEVLPSIILRWKWHGPELKVVPRFLGSSFGPKFRACHFDKSSFSFLALFNQKSTARRIRNNRPSHQKGGVKSYSPSCVPAPSAT